MERDRKMSLQDELHGALFLILFKSIFYTFKKFQSEILDVDNDLFYHAAKSQCKIDCIPAYIKMTNSDKSEDF
jgi:hypothetical protein